MSYLLDTNVLSEARKPRGNEGVKRWITSVPSGELYLSVLVIGEIRHGIELLWRSDPDQAEIYRAWLTGLRTDYADRILPITAEVAEEWGRINAPDPVPVVDGLMAATARVRGMVLVTRNTSDVERTGVRVLNPFEDTR